MRKRKLLISLLCFVLIFTSLGTGIVIPNNEISVDAASKATGSAGGSGGGSTTTPEVSGEYTYEPYSLPSGINGPKLQEVMNSTPLFYREGDTYTQLMCYCMSNYAYYFYLSGSSYSNCVALGYGQDDLKIRNPEVMSNLYQGTSTGGSGTTISGTIAQDGVYSQPVTVYKYKNGKKDKTYYGTVYVTVTDGKISGIGVSGDKKISKVVTSEIYHAYLGKTASVEEIAAIDAVSSASVSSNGGTGANDAVSSATVDTKKEKYYTSNLQDAILRAIQEAPKVEIPVEAEEENPNAVYIGRADVSDEEGSSVTLNVWTEDGVITDITVDEENSVGTWFSLLSKMRDEYVGKAVSTILETDAVSSATKYSTAFDEAVRDALKEGWLPVDDTVNILGYTLSLDGDIAINYYMQLGYEVLQDQKAEMQFDLPGTNHSDTKVALSKARIGIHENRKCYIFSAGIAAKEMTEPVVGRIVRSDGTRSENYSITIREYCEYIINHPGTGPDQYDETTVALAKAIENYGAYSQEYFNYKPNDLANANRTKAEKELKEVDVSSIDDPVKSGTCTGFKYRGTTAMLTTRTGLRHYFKLDGEANDYVFEANGKTLNVRTSDTGTYVLIDDIWAMDLDKQITLTVTNTKDKTSFQLSYSVYNYIKQILNSTKTADKTKNAVRALYAYGEAAEDYFGAHP